MKTIETKYRLFSPAELKPSGWLRKQLQIQANGLSGNLDKFWPSIKDSAWIGGPDDGWERVPYWLDGFIPLAYLLDDADMIGRARTYIDGILARQCEDGWICPCKPEERGGYDLWAALLITKVLAVYAECSGEKERMETAIYRVLSHLNRFLDSNTLKQWGQTRWFEGLIAAYWLYERRPEQWILDFCHKLSIHGTDWEKVLDSGLLDPVDGNWDWLSHVVNIAMALKSGALLSRLNGGNPETFAERFRKYLLERHGMACHHFSGDECLHGTSPISGTELCGVVEAMYSYQVLFRISGNPVWMDRLEELAFNALPATVSPDMWSHQYDQMSNQVVCREMTKSIFRTNGPVSNMFGLEPNYGCCTANFNQGFPKFAWASFMRGDGEIASCTLAPAVLSTTVNGVGVRCELSTDYPFNNILDYEIATDAPVTFTFSIRIPQCAASATVNGEPAIPGRMFLIRRTWSGSSRVRVELEFRPRFESRPGGLFTVWNGPLLFSLPIKEKWERVEHGPTAVFPHCDYRVLPQSDWSFGFACDAGDMKAGHVTPNGEFVFNPENPPAWLEARMAPLSWQSTTDACAEKPDSAAPTGHAVVKRLVPYGCTNLRITETFRTNDVSAR